MTTNLGTARIKGLQQTLRNRNIDALIAFKPENSFYLSGFNPIIYSHPVVALLPAKGDPAVLVHALRDDHARASAWVRDIRLYGAWSTKQTMGPNWLDALREILQRARRGRRRAGVRRRLRVRQRFEQLKALLPDARFEDTSDIIEHARYVKDAEEIRCARIAARLTDIGMDAALAAIAQGASEREVAIRAQAAMNELWLTRLSGHRSLRLRQPRRRRRRTGCGAGA